ncbi:hypothetical protein UFOVP515_28 [uncultured Caudovirales phage]|uniref:Portal protein n=1 Tax=uncultured Caudovirales phage TaxID=2100421 RepID=A0A6J5MMA4_9CAUD|nr:hypothetical protein UFOVP515_28 [uncultured Caudovirales phage]
MNITNELGLSTDIASQVDPTLTPMTDTDLEAIMGQEITDAVSYIDSDLSPIRARGTEYYRGDPFGNEEDGRSQVVAMEVRDTVSAMLPSLMRVFFSTENTVEFVPRGPEDVENAQQATDYCNYVFNNDNNGFMVAYATFKDALVRKCGIVKAWIEDTESVRIEEYSGLDDQTLQIVMQEGDADVKIVASYPDETMQGAMQIDPMTGQPMPPAMIHDVQIKRKVTDKRIHVACLPPEELLLSRQAMSFKDAPFIGHRKMATVAELISMGYDEDEVMDYVGSSDLNDNEEALARAPLANNQYFTESANPMMQRVLYVEGYAKVDFDGDGIPELRKMCFMGAGYKMVRNLPASYIPFIEFPCDPEPHTSPLEAMSIFDITRDLQEIKSEVMRNTLDSLAQSIHPRTVIVEGQVNIDDALNNETGAIIRARAPNMVQALTTPFVGQAAFPVLDYLDQIKEGRTGMSKASMGLNPDALQSSTKAAVAATVSASQGRIELTARLMAEGMRELFKTILFLVTTHQDKPRMIRLRNRWVQIDPRAWDNTMDVNINIGLGNGDTNERIATMMQILAKQESILNQYGLENPVVSPQMYVRTLKKVVELSGFKDASSYFADIPEGWKAPPAPQKPSPEEVLAQVQAESIRADIQKKAADLELQRQQMIRDDDFRRDQMNQDRLLKQMELELKYNTQLNTAQIVAEQNVNREVIREQGALVQQAMAQAQPAPMQPINPQGMV